MKKLLSLLLSAVMLCSMLAVFAVPAFAYSSEYKDGAYYYEIENGAELKNLLENCDSSPYTMYITLASSQITLDSAIITKSNHFVFKVKEGLDSCHITSTNDEASLFFVKESAANAIFEFQHPYIYVTSKKSDGDGGAIYIDADNVSVIGGRFEDCYTKTDGGAICIRGDYCGVKETYFESCEAGDDGGGIYVCNGYGPTYIEWCHFSYCVADTDGPCVCGNSNTYIQGNDPSFSDEDYYNCSEGASANYSDGILLWDKELISLRGTALSVGNVVIIAGAIIVAVFAAVVIVIVVKKKKKPATANGATVEKSEE